jgi:TRAP-type C4-dicarboxylate transport system substrate-binding protein
MNLNTFERRIQMGQNKWVIIGLFLLVSVSLYSLPPAFGQGKVIELNYSTFYPATHKMLQVHTAWAKEIEKRTNGRIKINIFPGGTLTSPTKCYEGVVNGISDIGTSVLGYTQGRFPLTQITNLPMGYKNGLIATRLVNEYYAKFRPKELDDVKVLFLFSHGPALISTKKPVYKLEDLKGMKIRSGAFVETVAALGATVVAMPVNEAYDAISKGVVEGIMSTPESLEGFKLAEVVKFTTENYGSAPGGGQFMVMNKAKWNALPQDIQTIMEKTSQEWIEKTGNAWIDIEDSGKAFFVKLGGKMIPLTKEEELKWIKAVSPVIDGYLKDTKAKGLPGEEVMNFYKDYLKKNL